MEEKKKVIRVSSRLPTERELFYLEWGRDLIKNQFNLANDILKQLISTSIALMSISVIFESVFENDARLKFLAVLFFFISLLVATIGFYPYSKDNVCFDCPEEIEQFNQQALRFKRYCYTVSGIFLLVGLGVVLLKVLMQVYG